MITALIERADGDAHRVLDLLHTMVEMVEQHIASQATVVDAKPKLTTDETAAALAIYKPRKH